MERELAVLAEFRVTGRQDGQRLDHFLKERIPRLSRRRIQEAIRARVEVEGRERPRPSLRLRAGNVVRIADEPQREIPIPPAQVPRVVYEDGDLVVVDKPAGLPVHAIHGRRTGHLIHWLRQSYGEELALAHRIDRETSGLVVSTRGSEVARTLGIAFASGGVLKEYRAVVRGVPREEMEIDLPIGRDLDSAVFIKQKAPVAGGSPSRTVVRLLEATPDGRHALVSARPATGRRHQIRVHLAAVGHPVVGDKLYAAGERHFLTFRLHGPNPRMLEELGAARQLLHAAALELDHPRTGRRLRLEAPLPRDFAPYVGSS